MPQKIKPANVDIISEALHSLDLETKRFVLARSVGWDRENAIGTGERGARAPPIYPKNTPPMLILRPIL